MTQLCTIKANRTYILNIDYIEISPNFSRRTAFLKTDNELRRILKGHCHGINMFLHQWKPKNNDAVLLPRTLSVHQDHLLPPSTQHGKDGNGLKFEKTSQFFQILEPFLENIARNSLWFVLGATICLICFFSPFEPFGNE